MGEIEVRGESALEFCQRMTANDISRMQASFQAQYNLLLNEHGGVIDDVIFYRLEQDSFFICVNASNSDKDFAWLRTQAAGAASRSRTSATSMHNWRCKGRTRPKFSSP